jgi:hypothetical protein
MSCKEDIDFMDTVTQQTHYVDVSELQRFRLFSPSSFRSKVSGMVVFLWGSYLLNDILTPGFACHGYSIIHVYVKS